MDRENWHARRISEPQISWREERLEEEPSFFSTSCLEIRGDQRSVVEVDVAVEQTISIYLDGQIAGRVPAIPAELKELAVGFLVGDGLVGSIEQVAEARSDRDRVLCKTRSMPNVARGQDDRPGHILRRVISEARISSASLLDAVDQLNQRARLWRRTGAAHAAMVCDMNGGVLVFCEDVSRSSAMDKALGSALLRGLELAECALVTSGRLSESMVKKSARAGVPILASKSAPIAGGVNLAREIDMTLVGFARRPNVYVYSGVRRVI
ncbi:MAG: formate dehydrogenase accessory protein [Methanosaeta sp. PtaB.Bin039]|nr:MAG: formate dehydrogenase accessory protein [Methanosaeta sp. PtaB.Bin039]OPY44358.1 MAG: formate dehydrogenase accessory protein [Methanosaeta sp. PtaU1.Bin028]HOT06222.1 formate dehydrogenase accessory sulfurtransferase FdhD [Methanotrichaceae archaeon]HQF15468.1 formate dehydrogenase accessory sulfurtransferase FdhD [Methanotrichaceae archaeon]HQI90203.1 formate dehydrogenase accessory sulfurtransferase FdhD [Methanotrichaceae archaeon]